jgi:hypothetical protein
MRKFLIYILFFVSATISHSQNLRLNLQQGETYYQNSKADISITQEIQGQTIDYSMTISGKMGFFIKEKGEDYYLMEIKYHSLAMKTVSPFGTMEVSTDKKGDTEDLMAGILTKMLTHSFEAKIDKAGSVEQIDNMDGIFTNLFEDYPDIPEMQKSQIKEQLKQSYGENSFKGNLQMITAIFPDKEVKVNDTWSKQVTMETSMAVLMDSEYTLKELTDEYALIYVSGTAKTSEDSEFQEMNGMPAKFDLSGNISGTMRINRETGWIEDSEVHQEFEGNVELGDSPQFPGGITIPMKMVNETMITN